jgi:hypothetical protein
MFDEVTGTDGGPIGTDGGAPLMPCRAAGKHAKSGA